MNRFTIEVHEDVSVAPLAKVLAMHGYQLKRQNGTNALELRETNERRAAIAAAHARKEALRRA